AAEHSTPVELQSDRLDLVESFGGFQVVGSLPEDRPDQVVAGEPSVPVFGAGEHREDVLFEAFGPEVVLGGFVAGSRVGAAGGQLVPGQRPVRVVVTVEQSMGGHESISSISN